MSTRELEQRIEKLDELLNVLARCALEERQLAEEHLEKTSGLIDAFLNLVEPEGRDGSTVRCSAALRYKLEADAVSVDKLDRILLTPIQHYRSTTINSLAGLKTRMIASFKKREKLNTQLAKTKDSEKRSALEHDLEESRKLTDRLQDDYEERLRQIDDTHHLNVQKWILDFTRATLEATFSAKLKLDELPAFIDQRRQAILAEARNVEPDASEGRSESEREVTRGYLYVNKKARWFVVTPDSVVIYKSWKETSVIARMDLLLCTLRPLVNDTGDTVHGFELVSPNERIQVRAVSQAEATKWQAVIMRGIESALKQRKQSAANPDAHNLLLELRAVDPQNNKCGDCNAPSPDWVVLNYGLLVCHACSGVHRSLGTHISKVRSLTMDDLEPQIQQLLLCLGNSRSNHILEAVVPANYAKPNGESASREHREQWIAAKYVEKDFFRPLARTPVEFARDMFKAIKEPDVRLGLGLLLRALLYGGDASLVVEEENNMSALHFASMVGNVVALELMLLNEASVNSSRDPNGWTPLHFAALTNEADSMIVLIGRDANVDAKDNWGLKPADIARENEAHRCLQILADPDRVRTRKKREQARDAAKKQQQQQQQHS